MQYLKWLVIGAIFLLGKQVQGQISGLIIDELKEPVVGASVLIEGTKQGAVTNFDGEFEINYKGDYPVSIVVQFIGYSKLTFSVEKPSDNIKLQLKPDSEVLSEVSVVERRLSEKQKESALTVEAMDALAIKETPSISFYEGLGNLKGVDMTSASIGFKVINTRGFNSTSPVRSLQLIDGVDNQAPGLNFSLGNFLGASELDVMNVDVIAGASTSFYGPNAFNGVIAMTTKNPFVFTGLDVSYKVGERNLHEFAVRWADKFQNDKGEDVFAYKINAYYLTADDWEATNLDATFESDNPEWNPGGYDAVNRYGDETSFQTPGTAKDYPGLGNYNRSGIEEQYLVDYDTRNLKFNTSLHYRIKPDLELSYAFNFGFGTTVYQGDNRYSLKDIQFFQNKLELAKKDKWFIRTYSTNEDAGNSYDAYFTALRMQDLSQRSDQWSNLYAELFKFNYSGQVRQLPGYPDENLPLDEYERQMAIFTQANLGALTEFHRLNSATLLEPDLIPGTPEFNTLFDEIRSTSFTDGGSLLEDRSALYHIQGEYKFDETDWGLFRIGGNGRLYSPNSNGTIFADTNGRQISVYEFGAYGGWEKRYFRKRLKTSVTMRIDKNQNFDFLVSPAMSLVYDIDEISTLRFSLSSAIRNPTLQDQYLYYNVGPARLIGNLEGYEGLVTLDEFQYFRNLPYFPQNPGDPSRSTYVFDYLNVDPVKPERVQTVEMGYRTTLFEALYVDLNYYYSWYQDFIGFSLLLDVEESQTAGLYNVNNVYRISTNATDQVTTQGFSAGLNYYFGKYYMVSGNYTWNVLNTATDDPIIPAFNTPENKYNISFGARDMPLWSNPFGFNVTYKWIQGFIFEGSPQFTGPIDTYDLMDAQVNYRLKSLNTTVKLGVSNLLNNEVFQVYGGPRVGRLAYVSFLYEFR